MAATRPVASTKRHAASTFGAIDPAAKARARNPCGVSRRSTSRPGLGQSSTTPRNVREEEERASQPRLRCEQRSREVLVDHGLHAHQAPGR